MKRVVYLPPRELTFSAELMRGIGLYCQKNGFWEFDIPGPSEWPYLRIIGEWDGDGVITQISGAESETVLRESGCPFVNLTAWAGVPTVTNDNHAIGRKGASFLSGKRFPGYVFVGRVGSIFSEERWQGFRSQLRESGHDPVLVQVSGRRWEVREQLADEMPGWRLPLAVMTSDDYLANEVLTAAARCALAADPSRMAVLGVNNSPQAELMMPPLSSVRLDGQRIGFAAARMLDRLMSGRQFHQTPVELVAPLGIEERASTAHHGIEDPLISRVLERMRRNAARAMSIEELLIDIPLSRRTFERHFKQAAGCTPWEEIRRVQVEHVRTLLEKSEWSIKRIALSSAFKTPSRLAAVFREATGETPQSYRRRYRL